jgi:O-methyltransferase
MVRWSGRAITRLGKARVLSPGPIDVTMNDASPEERYLDLLKLCLTRYSFGEEMVVAVPDTRWKRGVFQAAQRALARRGLVIMRRRTVDAERRESGRDWPPPAAAETMIGLKRLDNLQHCIDGVLEAGVPGDLIEAGVWRGGAAIFMRAVLAARGVTDRAVWAADSFQGLPKPRAEDGADAGDQHWKHAFLAVSIEEVQANFERYGLLDDQVRFLVGWFSDTLPHAPIEQLALLRIDGDMYRSTTEVLCSLYPRVAAGGFVIVDDYGAVPGCRTAVDEFRAAHAITEPLEWIDWTGVFWQRR